MCIAGRVAHRNGRAGRGTGRADDAEGVALVAGGAGLDVAELRAHRGRVALDDHVPVGDERDALGIVAWLLDRDRGGSLAASFELDEVGFGRVDGVSWSEQVEFEGWILGM